MNSARAGELFATAVHQDNAEQSPREPARRLVDSYMYELRTAGRSDGPVQGVSGGIRKWEEGGYRLRGSRRGKVDIDEIFISSSSQLRRSALS
jgi:hypothetical protein